MALTALALALAAHGVASDPWGPPLATNFASFWTAAKPALGETPEPAWDPAVRRAHLVRAGAPRGS